MDDNILDTPLQCIECCGLRIDLARHRAFEGDRELILTLTEFRLLHCLLLNPGRTFTRLQLAATILKKPTKYPRTIDQHVKQLRQKLTLPGLIESVISVGYRLGPCTQEARGG